MPSVKVHDIVLTPDQLEKSSGENADDESSPKIRKRTTSNNHQHHRANGDDSSKVAPTLSIQFVDTSSSSSSAGEVSIRTEKKPEGFVQRFERKQRKFFEKHSTHIRWAFGIFLLIAFHVYLGFAIAYSFSKALALVVLTIVAWVGVLYYQVVKPRLGPIVFERCYLPLEKVLARLFENVIVKIILYLIILAAIVVFLVLDTAGNRLRLVSLAGLAFYFLFLLVLSKHPTRVNWRPVLWGLLLQFIMGLIVLRWPVGSAAFTWLSDQFSTFISYTQNGTSFVYGFLATPPPICGMSPVFAFSAIQTVLYFSAVVNLLYYLGVLQFIIKKIAWLMTFTLGTTAVESLNAAANIFLGQTEAPLLIRPYMERMTESELFATMTGGFATVSGTVFAAYVSFGACPSYLLSASVMSATGSLGVSKLFYPETEESKCKDMEEMKMEKGTESNILEAISNGASGGIFMVANIAANLLVFLALLAFLDAALVWMGDMVGIEDLTFERLCSWIFFPLAYLMGAGQDTADVMVVAELMGIKTFLNEFIAYQKMGTYIQQGKISLRAQVVATYALCGFSNLGSVGIQLAGFSAMCPDKKSTFARIVLRSCIAGSVTTFMTACIAGLLTAEPAPCASAAFVNCTCLGNYGGCNGTVLA